MKPFKVDLPAGKNGNVESALLENFLEFDVFVSARVLEAPRFLDRAVRVLKNAVGRRVWLRV